MMIRGSQFPTTFERVSRLLARLRQEPGTESLRRFKPLVRATLERRLALRDEPLPTVLDRAGELRSADWRADDTLIAYGAIASELVRRLSGMEPHPVQLLGAISMLRGVSIDMATGEGKTLVGTIVAAGFAMRGRAVHALSANEYLARRDAEAGAAVFEALGLRWAAVTAPMTAGERRRAYRADIVFSTIQQVGFDLLRDRQIRHPDQRRLRDLDVAIIDELDAVLIDEALVPLILAGEADGEAVGHDLARLVASLRPDVDFAIDDGRRNVMLSETGVAHLERFFGIDNLYAHPDLLSAANVALHAEALLERDVHYLVRDGRISLVSESRGRIAPLQRWPDGLHAAVESKEGLATSARTRILDQTLVQSVARGYRTLVGMSGTALEGAERLVEDHGLRIGEVPTNRPCERVDDVDRLFATIRERDRAALDLIVAAHAKGQPVLVGTASVADSERFAGLLAGSDVAHTVLNAKHDAEEAEIIRHAGTAHAVTISTQMAGRGVDIRLDDRARELGGLLVVGLGRRASIRLDHQLRGRAGRQGDPGRSVFLTTLEDDVVTRNISLVKSEHRGDRDPASSARAPRIYRHAQRVAEGNLLQAHRKTSAYNEVLERQRRQTLAVRTRYLTGDEHLIALVTGLEDAGLERERARCLTEPEWIEFVRQLVLFRLDEHWSAHLALMAEVEEGIHLRALANANPLVEFTAEARAAFSDFAERCAQAVLQTLRDLDIDRPPGDLAEVGLRRPASTWTYMVEDNPFGTAADRVIRSLGRLLHRH